MLERLLTTLRSVRPLMWFAQDTNVVVLSDRVVYKIPVQYIDCKTIKGPLTAVYDPEIRQFYLEVPLTPEVPPLVSLKDDERVVCGSRGPTLKESQKYLQ